MKANELPKRIYCTPTNGGFYLTTIKPEPPFAEGVEYTRTDVFIEKVSEYFHRYLEDTKVIDNYREILVPGIQASYTSVEEFIEDFKNYMKEE